MREHPDVIETPWVPPRLPDVWEEDEHHEPDKRDEHGGMICSECGRRGPAGSLCYPMLIQ